ncbi:hypothetical protein M8C21_007610, partial [Ambrosia artemisiifolia]
MVTAGANQAFVNIVLALCDAGDSVVMFAPYYFNSYMSFQMTGVTDILVGPGDPDTLQPDAGVLEAANGWFSFLDTRSQRFSWDGLKR